MGEPAEGDLIGGPPPERLVDVPDLRTLFQRRYGAMARLAALLVGDVGRGEEIAQEAFAILWTRPEVLTRPGDLDAYLRTVVVNLARSAQRRRRLAWRHRGRLSDPAPVGDNAELVADRQLILEALKILSLRQRQCLVLRYYEDLAEVEVASALGISAGSVKSHTSRGLAALARMLGEPS